MTNVEKINKVLPNNHRYISENMANNILESKYNRQAVEFLLETETTCDIKFLGLRKQPWSDKKVNSYDVTLKNARHTYTYEFFDSIKNAEDGKKATYDFYSVIACMGHYVPESFDDFISEFGYEFKTEAEYIKVKNTHLACLDQVKNLKKLFTSEQLEKLAEIN